MEEKLTMGLIGIPLKDLTNEELSKLVNSCVVELNTRELENQKLDVNVGDVYIDNRKEHRKGIYIIKKVDKRKCYTTIEGMRYTIEYDNLDIIGGERFVLKTDILGNLQKLENFNIEVFENEMKYIGKLLKNQWNEYIDVLRERTSIELKWNELFKN